jgi:hypothetical protein
VSGKNIYLKNNLRSIQETKTESGKKKIDHMKGKLTYEDGGDWEMSTMGLYAKDVSDAHCGAVWNMMQNFRGAPKYMWDDDAPRSPDRAEFQELKNKLAARGLKVRASA